MKLGAEKEAIDNLELQMGVRFYANNDATEFVSTVGPFFDWYRDKMVFDQELNEEPVY